MTEIFMHQAPSTPADWQRLWSFTHDPLRTVRRPTREVRVGDIGIGGDNPIRLQSMTVSDTLDTTVVVDEIAALHQAGSEIVRVTAPNRKAAQHLGVLREELRRRGLRVPLVADIHFTPQAALIAALHVEKVRINPGNYADRKHFKKWEYTDDEYAGELDRLEKAFRPLVLRCKERGVAMRIGTNHGSLSDRILNRYGDTPAGMVESALEFVRICEHHGYNDLVLSMKASDVKVMIEAYRLLAARMRELDMDYPFHLGVTEAGAGLAGRIKSAAGIVSLLEDGIGDTVRVSLTEDSVQEIPIARALVAPFQTAREKKPGWVGWPPWNPYRFERRRVTSTGRGAHRLSSDHPPRVELVQTLPQAVTDEVAILAWLRNAVAREAQPGGADLLLVRLTPDDDEIPVDRALGALRAFSSVVVTQPALGLEIPWFLLREPRIRDALPVWPRLSLRIPPEEPSLADLDPSLGVEPFASIQYTLVVPPAADPDWMARSARRLAQRFGTGEWPPGAVAFDFVDWPLVPGPHPVRAFLAAWPVGSAPPLVLRGPIDPSPVAIDAHVSRVELRLGASLGSLLADGIGDAVQLDAGPDVDRARRLAFEVLQATRLRLSKADFIACPSCGRTQFDLQTTTARIEARLGHLDGVKIAVMGCIVNGPGEMADADFGYVGSGPDQIDLYVGRERVERNVPAEEADQRLVELIREHGLWVQPPSAPGPGNERPREIVE